MGETEPRWRENVRWEQRAAWNIYTHTHNLTSNPPVDPHSDLVGDTLEATLTI